MSKQCSNRICPLVVNIFVVEWVSLSSWWVITMSSLLLKSFLSDLNDSSKAKTSCLISFVWYKWCNINVMELQELEVRSNSRTKGPKHFQNFGKLSGKNFWGTSWNSNQTLNQLLKTETSRSFPLCMKVWTTPHSQLRTSAGSFGDIFRWSTLRRVICDFELQIFGYIWCSFGLYESTITYKKLWPWLWNLFSSCAPFLCTLYAFTCVNTRWTTIVSFMVSLKVIFSGFVYLHFWDVCVLIYYLILLLCVLLSIRCIGGNKSTSLEYLLILRYI